MMLKLYSVKDKLTGFGAPIPFKDEKVAIRWFTQLLAEKKATEYADPKYYDLYEVGDYDEQIGLVSGRAKSEHKLIIEGEQIDV